MPAQRGCGRQSREQKTNVASAVIYIAAAFTCLAIIGGGAWRLISAIWLLVSEVRACTSAINGLTAQLKEQDVRIADHETRLRKLEDR
jgi:hypothetical protein